MIYHFEVFKETAGADFKIQRYFMTYLQFTQQPSGQLYIVWYTTKRSDKKQSFLCKKEISALPEHTCQNNQTIGWNN